MIYQRGQHWPPRRALHVRTRVIQLFFLCFFFLFPVDIIFHDTSLQYTEENIAYLCIYIPYNIYVLKYIIVLLLLAVDKLRGWPESSTSPPMLDVVSE